MNKHINFVKKDQELSCTTDIFISSFYIKQLCKRFLVPKLMNKLLIKSKLLPKSSYLCELKFPSALTNR